MIECNEIAQVALELKMKFEACEVLKAEDLDTLVELVEAVNLCATTGGSSISADQVTITNIAEITATEVQTALEEIIALISFNQNNISTVVDLGDLSDTGNDVLNLQAMLDAYNALNRTTGETETVYMKANFIQDS